MPSRERAIKWDFYPFSSLGPLGETDGIKLGGKAGNPEKLLRDRPLRGPASAPAHRAGDPSATGLAHFGKNLLVGTA